MAKILGSWSGMRKYLEREMLAESLAGRIRYGCTHYVGMDTDRVFEICVDGKPVKRFSLETLNEWFLATGRASCPHPASIRDYWQDFLRLRQEIPPRERPEFTDDEFCAALETYRNQDIQASISDADPLVRLFAVLDRRLGKRTLVRLREALHEQPEWLREFYLLRLRAEELA